MSVYALPIRLRHIQSNQCILERDRERVKPVLPPFFRKARPFRCSGTPPFLGPGGFLFLEDTLPETRVGEGGPFLVKIITL